MDTLFWACKACITLALCTHVMCLKLCVGAVALHGRIRVSACVHEYKYIPSTCLHVFPSTKDILIYFRSVCTNTHHVYWKLCAASASGVVGWCATGKTSRCGVTNGWIRWRIARLCHRRMAKTILWKMWTVRTALSFVLREGRKKDSHSACNLRL